MTSASLSASALAAFREGSPDEAARLAKEALDLDPVNLEALMVAGMAAVQQARPEEARERFEAAVAAAPGHPSPHYHLARVLRGLGELDKAEDHLRMALAIQPRFADCYVSLAQLDLLRGRVKEVVDSLQKAAAIEPAREATHSEIVDAAYGISEREGADQILRELVAQEPRNAIALVILGWFLQQRGRWAEARPFVERAINLQPLMGLGFWALARERRLTDADRPFLDQVQSISRTPGLPPSQANFYFYVLGKGHDDLGEYELAMRSYDDANRLAAEARQGAPFDREKYAGYIERTMEIFSPEFLEANRSIGSEDETPIFIVGMVRSGTTLTDQILSSHPQVGSAGEQRFWLENVRNVFNDDITGLDVEALPGIRQSYLDLLRRIAPGYARVTDKMPLNVELLGLMHLLFPRAKVVHTRRNRYDNCLSIYTTPFMGPPDFAFNKGDIAFAYEGYTRLADYWRQILPSGSFFEVQYEELTADKERVVAEMLDYCGLEQDEACLNPERNSRLVTTPSSWQVRQPIYRSSVERWRRYEPWMGELLGSS